MAGLLNTVDVVAVFFLACAATLAAVHATTFLRIKLRNDTREIQVKQSQLDAPSPFGQAPKE